MSAASESSAIPATVTSSVGMICLDTFTDIDLSSLIIYLCSTVCYIHSKCKYKFITLECLINVPVRVFISRKMPPYTGLIWHYTFHILLYYIKKKNFFFFFFTFKCISLHILATQFLRNNEFTRFSCQRERVPLQCITGKASGRWSTEMLLVDTSSRHWLRLRFKQLSIQFVRFATLYSYLALYYY